MNNDTLYIITGVNRGLGSALFKLLFSQNQAILAISRKFSEDQINLKTKNIFLIEQDLSKKIKKQTKQKLKRVIKKYKNLVFINNASIINPIGGIGSFTIKEIKTIFNVNSISPIIIINHIIKYAINKPLTILNVSSGAAKRVIKGWSLYCTTKAANEMFFNSIASDKIKVINFNPGVIDTGMQEHIRQASDEAMPDVTSFKRLKKDKKLQHPEDVALKIIKLL